MTTSFSKAPVCVGCGAPAPAVLTPTTYECTFCHRSQVLSPYSNVPAPSGPGPLGVPFSGGAPPPGAPPFGAPPFGAPPPGAPFGGPVRMGIPSASYSGNAGARIGVTVGATIMAAAIAIVVAATRGGGGLGGPSRSGSGPGSGGVVPPGERLQWGSGRGTSVKPVGDINGDGVEDFVGRYRVLDLGSSKSTQTMFVGGFDGKTFQRIWATPPLGTLEQAGTSTVFAVAGDKVLVTDYRAQAHTLDVRTGKEIRLTALSDRAQFACSPEAGRTEVWVDVADNKHVLFDLAKGTATLAPKPAWCLARQTVLCSEKSFSDEPCSPTSDERVLFSKLGMSPNVVIRGDGKPVALGTKFPGTPIALIAAFDPKSQAIVWQQSVAPDAASAGHSMDPPATFANGRVYTTYKTTSPAELHVTAFEVGSGKRVMDFKVPRGDEGSEPEEVVVSAQRIYVPHWTWLDVFDAKDGRFIETVGMW